MGNGYLQLPSCQVGWASGPLPAPKQATSSSDLQLFRSCVTGLFIPCGQRAAYRLCKPCSPTASPSVPPPVARGGRNGGLSLQSCTVAGRCHLGQAPRLGRAAEALTLPGHCCPPARPGKSTSSPSEPGSVGEKVSVWTAQPEPPTPIHNTPRAHGGLRQWSFARLLQETQAAGQGQRSPRRGVRHEEAASPTDVCVSLGEEGLGAVRAISRQCWHSSPAATCYQEIKRAALLPHAHPARVPLLQPSSQHVALRPSLAQTTIGAEARGVSALPTAWALCHGQGTPGVGRHGTGICFNQVCSIIGTLLCLED